MNPASESAQIIRRTIQKPFIYDSTVVLTADLAYPEIRLQRNPVAQARINRQARREALQFFDHAKRTLYPDAIAEYKESQSQGFPFRPYETVMDYTITLNQGCTLSMYVDQYTYTGGAHGGTYRFSDTFSLRTGRRIRLRDLFPHSPDYRREALQQVLKRADARYKEDPNIFFEDYRTLIVKNFDPDSFFLTQSGVNVYYQQYEIGPYASGIIVFEIPYAALHIGRPGCH